MEHSLTNVILKPTILYHHKQEYAIHIFYINMNNNGFKNILSL